MDLIKGVGWKTASAIVIANMIGTGIFTSLGFQLVSTTNTWSIILLWVLGAIMALCGALSYAELGTHFNRSGGEYHFLSKTYHPLIGYLSGWVSLTVGFAAPVALAAMALGEYTGIYLGISPTMIALFVSVVVTVFHSFSLNTSSKVQNITTGIKILLIVGFIVSGFMKYSYLPMLFHLYMSHFHIPAGMQQLISLKKSRMYNAIYPSPWY